MDYDTWADWLTDNVDADEATKLARLRAFILKTAREQVAMGEIAASWATKKLAKLGITDPMNARSEYTLEAHASGKVHLVVSASSRAGAMEAFADRTNAAPSLVVNDIAVQAADAVFLAGPEDPDPNVVDPAAPATVQATLDALRETILLAVIAGPRVCDPGANDILASYALPGVPERRTFTVGIPVEGVMKTTVKAFDEASAKRVAGWRWDNNRAGFDLDQVADTDSLNVVSVA